MVRDIVGVVHMAVRIVSMKIVADNYHIFVVEWDENLIKWFIDGEQYHMATPDSLPGREWVFDHHSS